MQGQSPSRARQEEPGGRARFMPRVQSPCSQAVTATRAPTRGVKDSPARVVWACWHCSWAPSGALSRGCACCPASVRNLPRLRRRFQGPLLALCSGPPLPTACRQGVAFAWAEPRGAGRPKGGPHRRHSALGALVPLSFFCMRRTLTRARGYAFDSFARKTPFCTVVCCAGPQKLSAGSR